MNKKRETRETNETGGGGRGGGGKPCFNDQVVEGQRPSQKSHVLRLRLERPHRRVRFHFSHVHVTHVANAILRTCAKVEHGEEGESQGQPSCRLVRGGERRRMEKRRREWRRTKKMEQNARVKSNSTKEDGKYDDGIWTCHQSQQQQQQMACVCPGPTPTRPPPPSARPVD